MFNAYFAITIVILLISLLTIRAQYREDVSDDVLQTIQRDGYSGEIHDVQTTDGYILKMHRIPSGQIIKYVLPPSGVNFFERIADNVKNVIANRNRQPVLVMHGMFCSSADWVVAGPDKGLGYILADAGYDVWMGNARGNKFSRRHLHYSPDNEKFWKFGWHEIGVHDLPAMINYILRTTNSTAVHYVGHSQGVTTVLVLTSMKPSYNDKLLSVNAMAPIAYMGNIQNPIVRGMTNFVDEIESMADTFGIYDMGTPSSFTRGIWKLLCHDLSLAQELCAQGLFAAVGFNSEQLNRTMLSTIFENVPAGISVRQFIHYGQLIRSGKFQMFDFNDALKNMKAYGLTFPPEYILSNVRVPMAMYYGSSDSLLSVEDAMRLTNDLGRTVKRSNLISGWNHVDFLFGIDANDVVYSKIIDMMRDTSDRFQNRDSDDFNIGDAISATANRFISLIGGTTTPESDLFNIGEVISSSADRVIGVIKGATNQESDEFKIGDVFGSSADRINGFGIKDSSQARDSDEFKIGDIFKTDDSDESSEESAFGFLKNIF